MYYFEFKTNNDLKYYYEHSSTMQIIIKVKIKLVYKNRSFLKKTFKYLSSFKLK